jgi:hypothetical protein
MPWTPIGQFLLLSARPFGSYLEKAQIVGVPGATVVAFVAFAFRFGVATGTALLLGGVGLLFLVAGTRLTIAKQRREETEFDLSLHLEQVPWVLDLNGVRYTHGSVLWVSVINSGPTSKFAARVRDISGVPSSWGTSYEVDPASWEQVPDPEITIPRGGRRRLKVVSILKTPRAFWFYSGQWGKELPGNQWQIPPSDEPTVDFTLEVVNTGHADQTVGRAIRIIIPLDVSTATAQFV